ncbi:hypothetical protein EJ04DRAFT_505979, partial [Polyplosphaeria fusca]
SIRTQLVAHENKQLRAALNNEKKRHHRGKPLLLQRPNEYSGGAVFWSPTKVKDAQKLLQQQQKEEAIQQRASEKAAKAAIREERRQEASVIKQRRVQEKELKAQQREERRILKAADLQLREDLQQSQKRKARTKKAVKQSTTIIPSQSASIVERIPVEVARVSLPKATRTRKVQPPERYLI